MTRRLATNAVPRLDVFMLHRSGALTSGAITRWQWPLPTMTLTITARAEGHRLFLKLNDEPEVAYGIIRRPGTTGNTFPVFECSCERTSRFLYIQEGRIACHYCQNLTWPSRQPGQWNTTARQISRLRGRLAALETRALAESTRRRHSVKTIQEASHAR
jgi:hypothetical protein